MRMIDYFSLIQRLPVSTWEKAGFCLLVVGLLVLFKNLFMAEPCTLNPTTLECLPQNSLNPSPSRAGNRQVSRAFQKGHSAWKMIPMDQFLLPTLLSSIPVPCGVNQMPQRILKLMFSFFLGLYGQDRSRQAPGWRSTSLVRLCTTGQSKSILHICLFR